MTHSIKILTAVLSLGFAAPALADAHMQPLATAPVTGATGGLKGNVTLNATASGMVLVQIDLSGVPAGVHAVHLHETGDCSAADFTSAGGHIPGERQHGVLTEDGPHPGDMPNVTVGPDGVLKTDVFLSHLDPETMIMDEDGAAFVVHEGADDYTSQPAGDAGSRIACGVFGAME